MTPTERQQSLINARLACEFLGEYLDQTWRRLQEAPHREPEYPARADLESINCLVAEFTRLDEKEQAQIEAGKLGAPHGSKGGWKKGRPRGLTKEKK